MKESTRHNRFRRRSTFLKVAHKDWRLVRAGMAQTFGRPREPVVTTAAFTRKPVVTKSAFRMSHRNIHEMSQPVVTIMF